MTRLDGGEFVGLPPWRMVNWLIVIWMSRSGFERPSKGELIDLVLSCNVQ